MYCEFHKKYTKYFPTKTQYTWEINETSVTVQCYKKTYKNSRNDRSHRSPSSRTGCHHSDRPYVTYRMLLIT